MIYIDEADVVEEVDDDNTLHIIDYNKLTEDLENYRNERKND